MTDAPRVDLAMAAKGGATPVAGGGEALPGYHLMPDHERRKTARYHYRWEIRALNEAALAEELPVWRANAEANRPFWEKAGELKSHLRDRRGRRDKVCAVCGSGPSLGYELPDLHRLRDRLVVVAVDSALYPLKLVGVNPDFVFVRNADPVTVDLIHRYDTKKSVFVLPVGAHPDLVARIEGRILFYVPVDEHPELAAWGATFPARLPRLVLKPSTGAMAFHFSRLLECGRTCLEGFDFAFSYGKYWCDAVRYLDDPGIRASLEDTPPPELAPIQVNDIFQEKTWTNVRLNLSAEELFRAIRYGEMEDVYNASLGLLFNVKWLPLKYVVELMPRVDELLPAGSLVWEQVKTCYPDGDRSKAMNQRTSNAYIALASRNIVVNHEKGHVKHRLNEFFERAKEFESRTAVVAGAGPSLDDVLEPLKRNRDRYFLMAVDASLHPLLTAGLRPDATISIDPERRVGLFFEGVDTRGLALIAALTTHPEVAHMWQGDVYWSFMVSPVPHLCQLIALYDKVSLMLPYGNCGSTGILLCRTLHFKRIVYAGVDFAYTHNRAYCRNMKIESELQPDTKEGVEALLARKGTGKIVRDVRGNDVWTDAVMQSYAEALVATINSVPEERGRFVNAGAGITHGVPLVDDLDAFLREG